MMNYCKVKHVYKTLAYNTVTKGFGESWIELSFPVEQQGRGKQ